MLQFTSAGSVLLPAKAHLAQTTVGKYRELLRKFKANGTAGERLDESGAAAFQQAKERVLARVRERSERVRVDPLGALHRLQERLAEARVSLRGLREDQRQRLQRYYVEAVSSRGGSGGPGLRQREPSDVTNEQADAAALSAVTHSNALFRVRIQAAHCCSSVADEFFCVWNPFIEP